MQYSPIEEKIINATIECIEKYGIKGTTNRQIAKIAGVNGAAVNYYFRSKENLINHCMETTLNNAFDWKDIEKLPGDTAREKCKAVFSDILDGGLKFPGISRAHFYDLIVDANYTSMVVAKLNEFLGNLVTDLKSKGTNMSEAQLYLACTQITSAVVCLILMPNIFEKKFGVDLNNPGTINQYIQQLVDALIE
jgi:AcrR family transcriptional regulator